MTIFCLKLAVFSKPLPTFEELGNEATRRTVCVQVRPDQARPGQNGTFDLMSMGGLNQPDVSLCTACMTSSLPGSR